MIWNFDPVLFSFAGLTIHWYGAIFAAAIAIGYRCSKFLFSLYGKAVDNVDGLLFYVVIGVIVGARVGHCFFYDPQYFIANPLKIFAIWEGGLASHGGGLGAILGIYLFSIKHQLSFVWLLDRVVVPTALFGFFVRVANFLNSEILGDKTDVPWAVVFSLVDNVPRHPAQLYEAFGYFGTFIVLFIVSTKTHLRHHAGAITGLFFTLVFTIRFLVEYIKIPQESYYLGVGLNTGQMLSLPFLFLGICALAVVKYRYHASHHN